MAFRPDIIAGQAVILVRLEDTIDKQLRTVRMKLRRFSNTLMGAGGDLFRFGAVGTLGSLLPVREFMEFQDQLLFLQTKLRATNEEMKGLEETIRALGRTTSFSPKQVAQAATEFAKAGFSIKETTNSLQAALDLARAGQVDLATATAILSNNLRTFGKDATYASEFASKFVTAARLGTLDIVDLNESLKESSGTFRLLNVDLDTSLGLITQLSLSSLKATKAGTSLNTAFINLARRAKDVNELIGGGFQLQDQDLSNPLSVLTKMGAVLSKLPRTEQVSILNELTNIRGGRAISAILIQGLTGLNAKIQEIKMSMDEAREAAEKLDSQLGGSFRRAKSAFEELTISLGETTEGPLTAFLDTTRVIFEAFSKLAKENPKAAQGLLALGPGLLAGGVSLIALGKAFTILASAMTPLVFLNKTLFKFLQGIAGKAIRRFADTLKDIKKVGLTGILKTGVFKTLRNILNASISVGRGSLIGVLLIFWRNVPFVAKGIDMLKRSFNGLMRDISLLRDTMGPALGIIKDGFDDLFAGNSERGMGRIKRGLTELKNIVEIGLINAFKKLAKEVEPVTIRIKAAFQGILDIIGSIIGGIGTIVSKLQSKAGSEAFFEQSLADMTSPASIQWMVANIQRMIDYMAKVLVDAITALSWIFEQLVTAIKGIPGWLMPKTRLEELREERNAAQNPNRGAAPYIPTDAEREKRRQDVIRLDKMIAIERGRELKYLQAINRLTNLPGFKAAIFRPNVPERDLGNGMRRGLLTPEEANMGQWKVRVEGLRRILGISATLEDAAKAVSTEFEKAHDRMLNESIEATKNLWAQGNYYFEKLQALLAASDAGVVDASLVGTFDSTRGNMWHHRTADKLDKTNEHLASIDRKTPDGTKTTAPGASGGTF